ELLDHARNLFRHRMTAARRRADRYVLVLGHLPRQVLHLLLVQGRLALVADPIEEGFLVLVSALLGCRGSRLLLAGLKLLDALALVLDLYLQLLLELYAVRDLLVDLRKLRVEFLDARIVAAAQSLKPLFVRALEFFERLAVLLNGSFDFSPTHD